MMTTRDLKFALDKSKTLVVTRYTDADWANDRVNRKSTTGNLFKLENNISARLSRK